MTLTCTSPCRHKGFNKTVIPNILFQQLIILTVKGLASASTSSSTADMWSLSGSTTGAGARCGAGAGARCGAGAGTASPDTASPNNSSRGGGIDSDERLLSDSSPSSDESLEGLIIYNTKRT